MLKKYNLLIGSARRGVVAMLDAPYRENVTILRGHVVRLHWEAILSDKLLRGEFSIIRDLFETLVKK